MVDLVDLKPNLKHVCTHTHTHTCARGLHRVAQSPTRSTNSCKLLFKHKLSVVGLLLVKVHQNRRGVR